MSKLTFPEIPKNRTLADLEQMSDDEIRALLSGNVSIITVLLAHQGREMRQRERVTQPHWSLTPMFCWVVASAILTAIATAVSIVLAMR